MRFLASIPESLDSILQMEGILTCLLKPLFMIIGFENLQLRDSSGFSPDSPFMKYFFISIARQR
jgi:hypothetical protein